MARSAGEDESYETLVDMELTLMNVLLILMET